MIIDNFRRTDDDSIVFDYTKDDRTSKPKTYHLKPKFTLNDETYQIDTSKDLTHEELYNHASKLIELYNQQAYNNKVSHIIRDISETDDMKLKKKQQMQEQGKKSNPKHQPTELAKSEDVSQRIIAAQKGYDADLSFLITDPNPQVRSTVLSHERLKDLAIGAKDPNETIRIETMKRYFNLQHYDKVKPFNNDISINVRSELNTLRTLLKKGQTTVPVSTLSYDTDDLLNVSKNALSINEDDRLQAAINGDLNDTRHLAYDPNINIRKEVLKYCQPEVLDILKHDPNITIRQMTLSKFVGLDKFDKIKDFINDTNEEIAGRAGDLYIKYFGSALSDNLNDLQQQEHLL